MGMNRKYARWELKSKRMDARKAKADAKARKAEAEAAKAESAAMERMARAEAKRDRTSRHGMRYSSTKDKTPTTKESHWEFGLFNVAKAQKRAGKARTGKNGRKADATRKKAVSGGKLSQMAGKQTSITDYSTKKRRNKKQLMEDKVVTMKTESVKVAGKRYRIPVNDDGFVPKSELVARFLAVNEGNRRGEKRNPVIDQDLNAKVIIEGDELTPKQVKDWWAYPNESDIRGIDTMGSDIFNLSGASRKSSMNAQKKVAILGDEDEVKAIRKALEKSFTVKEMQEMVKDHGVTVSVQSIDNAGSYFGKRGDSYRIELLRSYAQDPDTIVHEFVHHSRAVDKNRKGVLARTRNASAEGIRIDDAADLNLEEAATTAETLTRLTPYYEPSNPGYYMFLTKSKTANKLRREDRELFVGNAEGGRAGKKGKKALNSLERNFRDSNISELVIKRNGIPISDRNAKDRLQELDPKD
jgi:hypothetical protein